MLTILIDFALRVVLAVASVGLCAAVMGLVVGVEVLRYKDAQKEAEK